MSRNPWPILALALLVVPGCVHWDQPGSLRVHVLVTGDYGAVPLKDEVATVADGSTVMDALAAVANVETRYGGGFVESVDGLRSEYPQGRLDWFFEVNGWYADVGAVDVQVRDGDEVQWDFREWNHGEAPGLFNTFRWQDVPAYVKGLDPAQAPAWLDVNASAPWPGPTSEAPWILVASPKEAPWDLVPWVRYADPTLEAGSATYSDPWALVSRALPATAPHAVIVLGGASPEEPDHGVAWITTSDGVHEARP